MLCLRIEGKEFLVYPVIPLVMILLYTNRLIKEHPGARDGMASSVHTFLNNNSDRELANGSVTQFRVRFVMYTLSPLFYSFLKRMCKLSEGMQMAKWGNSHFVLPL